MTTSTDPLTAALLPVVLHKLNNATQLLVGMNTLLGMEGGDALVLERTDDLATSSRTIHQLGWAMAILASASGADLLLDRREPDGLEILIDLLVDAARRSDRSLTPPPAHLPQLAPAALDGWQVPWGLATMLHAASTDTPSCTWDLTLHPDGSAHLTVPTGPAVTAAAQRVLPQLPGTEFTKTASSSLLRMPSGWLVK